MAKEIKSGRADFRSRKDSNGFVTATSAFRIYGRAIAREHDENQLRRVPVPAGDHNRQFGSISGLTLSFRDVEDLLAERGSRSPMTVRRWVNHFGPKIAAGLRKRRPKPYTTWHVDEVYLKIDGRIVYLWRAIDAEGEVLDVPVQSKRNKAAATKSRASNDSGQSGYVRRCGARVRGRICRPEPSRLIAASSTRSARIKSRSRPRIELTLGPIQVVSDGRRERPMPCRSSWRAILLSSTSNGEAPTKRSRCAR